MSEPYGKAREEFLYAEVRALRRAGAYSDAEATMQAKEFERIVFALSEEIIRLRKKIEMMGGGGK